VIDFGGTQVFDSERNRFTCCGAERRFSLEDGCYVSLKDGHFLSTKNGRYVSTEDGHYIPVQNDYCLAVETDPRPRFLCHGDDPDEIAVVFTKDRAGFIGDEDDSRGVE
jgi:hypothetical protein